MSFKALMVDVDGVIVIRPDGRRWDADMEADLGVKVADMQEKFFAARFHDIVRGRADLEPHLAEALADFAPHVSARQMMDYWFAKDSRLDHQLLEDLAGYRAQGVVLHLATIQEHRRADYLWTTLNLRERFDGLHHSARYQVAKPELAYFRAVEAQVGFSGPDLVLIDDGMNNVEGARAAGWRAAHWTGQERLADVLARL
jgi:putative hydrolase of the HAD superfamily